MQPDSYLTNTFMWFNFNWRTFQISFFHTHTKGNPQQTQSAAAALAPAPGSSNFFLIVCLQLGYISRLLDFRTSPPPRQNTQLAPCHKGLKFTLSAHMFPLLTCRFVMQIFCFHLLVIYRKLLTEKPMESGQTKRREGAVRGGGGKNSHFYADCRRRSFVRYPFATPTRLSLPPLPFDMCAPVCVCVFAFESFVCAKSD